MNCKYYLRVASMSLLLLFLALIGFAQTNFKPGYVVTLEQDTLRGTIDHRGDVRNSKLVVFRNEKGEQQKYSPEEIKGYVVDGTAFKSYTTTVDHVSLGTKEKTYFLKVLESGRVDFLYLRDDQSSDRYFIVKDEGDLLELTNDYTIRLIDGKNKKLYDRKYLATLRLNLTDCDEIDNLAIKAEFTEKALFELIHKYNNCFRTEESESSFKEAKLQVRIELYAGHSQSKVVATGIESRMLFHPVEGVTSPTFSTVFGFSSPKMNKAISLNVGFDYIRKGAICENTRELDLHYLDFRLYPTYTWPKGSFRPMISGGFLFGKRLNSAETAVTYVRNGERKRFSTVDPKAEMGYGIEVGADYYFRKTGNHSLNLRTGYTKAQMNFNIEDQAYYNQTLYLKLGYAF